MKDMFMKCILNRLGLLWVLLAPALLWAQKKTIPLKEADLVIENARILPAPGAPVCKTMVVKDGKVTALYPKGNWRRDYQCKEVINARKKYVLPGFIDAHCHFLGLGKALDEVNLYGTRSWEEVLSRVSEFIKAHPEKVWINGRGWDQNDWQNKAFPDNSLLDRIAGEHHVVLSRIDGHAVIANSRVMELAGIDIHTKVAGGEVRIAGNRPTGLLIDKATELVESRIPDPGQSQKIKWLLEAQKMCHQYGIVQVADAGLPVRDNLLIDSLCDAGVLNLRFYLMLSAGKESCAYIEQQGALEKDKVKMSSLKIYSDGALGSRGALLKEAYCDDKSNFGLRLIEPQALDSLLWFAYRYNLQANTHCIGDSANALVLKAYAGVLNGTNTRRWRIEHAQVVDPEDLKYFKAHSIIPSVQPTHATSDMYWAEHRLCRHRMQGAYAYKTLLNTAGIIALGTDFPVEYVSPFNTIRAARFRVDANRYPPGAFYPGEALSAAETFSGMTLWAATANFWEQQTGSLEVGKWADFIVLDDNPYTAGLKKLNKLMVLQTFVGGKPVMKGSEGIQ